MQENNKENLSINGRISQIIDYYGLSRYKFSKETGISEAVLLNIYKGKNKPGFEFLEKLLHKYEAINANWLLTGEGEMLRSDPIKVGEIDQDLLTVRNEELPPGPCRQCYSKDAIIAAQQETIDALKEALVAYKARDDKESDGQKRKKAG